MDNSFIFFFSQQTPVFFLFQGKKRSRWKKHVELRHMHRTSVLSNPTTDVRGRMKVRGRIKKEKRGYFFKGVRHCFCGFPVSPEIHQAVNRPMVQRTISCNIHQRRGIMFARHKRKQGEGQEKKMYIANDALEMLKVEELQQWKNEKRESR